MNAYPALRNFENPMVTGLGAALDARDRAGAAVRAARKCLFEVFCESVPTPSVLIPTPGFGKHHFTVAEVIADSFAGRDGDEILNELLRIVARAAEGLMKSSTACRQFAGSSPSRRRRSSAA